MSTVHCPFCREDIPEGTNKCESCGNSLQMHFESGTDVRGYRITQAQGMDATGETYRAVHSLTNQTVMMKVVSPTLMQDDLVRGLYLEEAQAMANVKHPNIELLREFFEEGDRFFLITALADGETLEDVLARRELPFEEAMSLSLGILTGLHFAHTQPSPVIHRGLRPQNIIVCKDGTPVLTDFGVANTVGRARLAGAAGVPMNYEYMSPEQARGDKTTPRRNLYSLGILLYRMLTGVVPFPQETEAGLECMRGHFQGTATPLQEFREDVPGWVQGGLDKLLAKDPKDRFSSADDVAKEISARLGETQKSPPQSPAGAEPKARPTRSLENHLANAPAATPQKRTQWLVVTAILALVLGGGALALWHNGSKTDASGKERSIERSVPTAPKKDPVVSDVSVEAVCQPSCSNRQCGDDGCGSSCGACPSHQTCEAGSCVCGFKKCLEHCCNQGETCGRDGGCCAPTCQGRDCGDDGCGGTCGSCSGRTYCKNFRCQIPQIEELHPNATGSSWNYKASNPDRYNPTNLLDDTGETGWCKDDGIKEWIHLTLPEPVHLFHLRVRNGLQKTTSSGVGDLFRINSRVQSMTVVFDDSTTKTIHLTDDRAWQRIDLGGVFSGSVKIVVESAFWGRDKSICISDLILEGDR
jgi:serine/threonine protein kinase